LAANRCAARSATPSPPPPPHIPQRRRRKLRAASQRWMATALLAASTRQRGDPVLTAGCPCGHRTGAPHLAAAALLALGDQVSCLLCRSRPVRSISTQTRWPVGAFGCRIGLFVAVRSWLACAVLSAWVSLAELGLLHRPSSLSPVVAVRHSLIGRPVVWCFSARQVIGFGGTGVEVDDFEARGSCRLPA
jgi:hypothetical protein